MTCLACKHYQLGAKCPAYPNRIPLSIISGELLHLTVLPNQQAAIVFEYGPNEVNGGMLEEEPDDYGREYPLLPGFTPTLGLLSRAKGKGKKKEAKKCQKGQVCGLSCIAKTKTCIADMTLAQLMEHNRAKRAERRAKAQAKKAAAGGGIKPSSEVTTYQEAIERGKAIAAKFERTPATDADIKRYIDIEAEMEANWKEYTRLGEKLYYYGEALPDDQSQLLKAQRDAIEQKNKQLNDEAVSISKRRFEPVDYDGLTQQMKSMSGVDAATAKSIVEGMDFDKSLKKPRQLNRVKYNHDVEELKRQIEEYLMLTGDKTKVDQLFQDLTKDGKRAYAWQKSQDENVVNIGTPARLKSAIKETLFHELTHPVEYQNPEKARIAMDWVKSRATGDPMSLNDLTKSVNKYEDDEIAYPDKFINPYVGKTYELRGKNTTEVLTMGVQHFASKARLNELYNKDKEHFYLTLGLIAG